MFPVCLYLQNCGFFQRAFMCSWRLAFRAARVFPPPGHLKGRLLVCLPSVLVFEYFSVYFLWKFHSYFLSHSITTLADCWLWGCELLPLFSSSGGAAFIFPLRFSILSLLCLINIEETQCDYISTENQTNSVCEKTVKGNHMRKTRITQADLRH